MAVPKNPRGTLLLLVEAELAAAGSREHRVELRSEVSHSVLNLRAQVSRHSQVFCVDAMKKLSCLCDQYLKFAVIGDVAKLEVRQEFNEIGYGCFLETQRLAIRSFL